MSDKKPNGGNGALSVVDKRAISDPKRGNWVLGRIDDIIKSVESEYTELCALFSEVMAESYHLLSDNGKYNSFEEYVRVHVGWNLAKVKHFVHVNRKLIEGARIPSAEIEKLQWTKAAQIAALPFEELRPEKRDRWFEKARTSTLDQLTHDVRVARGVAKPDDEVWQPFSLRLAPGQMERVLLALEIAGKMDGSDKRCHLLDIICADFIAGRHKEVGLKLQVILATLEDAFEVELMAFRVKGSRRECLFSSRALRKHVDEIEG